jgi:hypothetical protein
MARPPAFMTTKTRDMRAIDLAFLRRKGARNPGYAGRVTWSNRGEVRASINYRIEHAGIRLTYICRRHGQETLDISEVIPVVTTPTRFNGVRHWFSCPSCRRRSRIIYGGVYFRCRRCHRLKYESQYEDEPNRISGRRWRIRERLQERGSGPWPYGLDDGFPPKPPRMHWRTYRRLEALDDQLSLDWTMQLAGWLERSEQRLRSRFETRRRKR